MVVQKETFTDRAKAGRALVFTAAALKPFQSSKAMGSIGGFPIAIHKFEEHATISIQGKSEYKANVSDSPVGAIASIEHALEGIEDRLRERETNLKKYRKQREDLTRQLDHPFEHGEKLAAATKRQQEIVAALDITKYQASTKINEGSKQVIKTVEKKPRENIRVRSRVAMAVKM